MADLFCLDSATEIITGASLFGSLKQTREPAFWKHKGKPNCAGLPWSRDVNNPQWATWRQITPGHRLIAAE